MARKRQSASATTAATVEEPRSFRLSHSIDVRKISNGYIVRHTHSGSGMEYHEIETYHPKKPKVKLVAPVSTTPKAMAPRFRKFIR